MATMDKTETFQWTNVWNQYHAAFTANLIMLGHGLVIGWLSPALAILSSENTPLSTGPLTNDEVSWIGSINCVGGLCGSFLFGYIASIFGCKRALFYTSLPAATFWVLIYFGSVYYQIFAARLICGMSGGGIQTCAFLFISEIANDDIRGRLGSITQFMRNVGILFAFILGSTVDYQYIPCACICIPILFMILFFMLPNSPEYFLRRGHSDKAENALKYYKGYKGETDRENCALYKEFERLKSIVSEQKTAENLQASDFFNRTALKGLGIVLALSIIVQFPGNFIIISYAVMIFAKAGTTIDPYVSSIYMAVALILGSLATTYLSDIMGRKILNLISLMGSAIGLFAISLYYYLHINGYDLEAFEWVPVVSLSFVVFISSAGIVTLLIVCGVEYLPTKVRTAGTTMMSVTTCISAFVISKLFPILLEIVDLHGCMIILGTGCIIGFFFVLIVMKETSGQSLDDVGKSEKDKMEQFHASRVNSITC